MEGWIKFAFVVQAQFVARPVVQGVKEPANVHSCLLVVRLQWQREGGNRLAHSKGIRGGIGSAVTPAHQVR